MVGWLVERFLCLLAGWLVAGLVAVGSCGWPHLDWLIGGLFRGLLLVLVCVLGSLEFLGLALLYCVLHVLVGLLLGLTVGY